MTILTKREIWKRERTPRHKQPVGSIDRLSSEQSANVRRSLDLVRMRHGDWKGVRARWASTRGPCCEP